MTALSKGNQLLRVAMNAPAIGIGYAIVGYGIVTIGCTPPFSDVDFFGVRVTVFLLSALTVAALILTVFAAMNVVRVLRILQRRHRDEEFRKRLMIGTVAILLALVVLAVTAWLGLTFLSVEC